MRVGRGIARELCQLSSKMRFFDLLEGADQEIGTTPSAAYRQPVETTYWNFGSIYDVRWMLYELTVQLDSP